MTKFNPNGRILWRGLSPYNGKPIVCIVTGLTTATGNAKTGEGLLQTWILFEDLKPNEAFKIKEFGESVCGDCPHATYNKPKENGFATCYVRTYHAPRAVWECYKNGQGYAPIGNDWHLLRNKGLRLGSFGDPAMVPIEVWKKALKEVYFDAKPRERRHTGYTHQWRKPFAQGLKGLVMASADGMRDYIESTANGWTPFLVQKSTDKAPKDAIRCPASAEAGRKVQCSSCHTCNGSTKPVVIINH
jgi:hypothetical protein